MSKACPSLAIVLVVVAGAGCLARRDVPPALTTPVRRSPIVVTNGPPEFRPYDQALASDIQERWWGLVDTSPPASYREGKVVLRFLLHNGGHITNITVLENTTDTRQAWICKKAIMDNQPYAAWPPIMLTIAATNSRSITFTFNYE